MQTLAPTSPLYGLRPRPGTYARLIATPAPAKVEPEDMAPGFTLFERPEGLHLVRTADGQDMGIMSSARLAAIHSHALSRMTAGARD